MRTGERRLRPGSPLGYPTLALLLARFLFLCVFLLLCRPACFSLCLAPSAFPSILRVCLCLPYFGRVNAQVGVFVSRPPHVYGYLRSSWKLMRVDVVFHLFHPVCRNASLSLSLSLIPRMHVSSSLSPSLAFLFRA